MGELAAQVDFKAGDRGDNGGFEGIGSVVRDELFGRHPLSLSVSVHHYLLLFWSRIKVEYDLLSVQRPVIIIPLPFLNAFLPHLPFLGAYGKI